MTSRVEARLEARVGPWRRRATDARAALVAFITIEVVAFPLLLWLGRGAWFTDDDWDFFGSRTAGSMTDLFRPHFQHWVTLPILAYRLWFVIVGLHSYVPYQAMVVALHLTAVALLRVVMRRAGVRAWTATLFAAVLVFFAAGAENILVAFQIAFVGAFVCGLAQLLLADHDGPLDRRDLLGLLAGFAGLMFSGVAITMTVIVGLAVLLRRRGRRIALFHTGPLAIAYLVWWRFAPKGQSADVYRSQSPLQVLRFVAIGVRTAFGGLGRISGLGFVFGILLIAGLVVAYRAGDGRALRSRGPALLALLGGALVFLVVTGLVRSGQPPILKFARATGPSRAKESRYQYLVVAMVLPAIALAADAVMRRWRRLVVPVLALPLVGLPSNLQHLDTYASYYKTLPVERTELLALPHVSRVDEFRGSRMLVPLSRLAAQGLTIGWVAGSGSSFPSPRFLSPLRLSSTTLFFALAPSEVTSPNVRCQRLLAPEVRVLAKGEQLTVELGNVLVTYLPPRYTPSAPALLRSSTVVAVIGPLRLRIRPESPGVMLCA